MTHDVAVALSRRLADAGYAHVVEVGVYENMAPAIQARVDLRSLRRWNGTLAAAVAELEAIGAEFDAVLETSLLGDGLTFATRAEAAARPWVHG